MKLLLAVLILSVQYSYCHCQFTNSCHYTSWRSRWCVIPCCSPAPSCSPASPLSIPPPARKWWIALVPSTGLSSKWAQTPIPALKIPWSSPWKAGGSALRSSRPLGVLLRMSGVREPRLLLNLLLFPTIQHQWVNQYPLTLSPSDCSSRSRGATGRET